LLFVHLIVILSAVLQYYFIASLATTVINACLLACFGHPILHSVSAVTIGQTTETGRNCSE